MLNNIFCSFISLILFVLILCILFFCKYIKVDIYYHDFLLKQKINEYDIYINNYSYISNIYFTKCLCVILKDFYNNLLQDAILLRECLINKLKFNETYKQCIEYSKTPIFKTNNKNKIYILKILF